MKKLPFILAALVLTGCKTEIEKDISLNQLLNSSLKTENATLSVEIASCQDHRDSRQPSQTLISAQLKIPQVFKNANFKECYSSNFKSFAVFEFPVGIGVPAENTKLENDINIISRKDIGKFLVIGAKKSFRERLDNFKKSEPLIAQLELGITFNILNDLQSEQKLNIVSSYINEQPFINALSQLKSGEMIKVKLSNVASDQLVSTGEQGGIVDIITQSAN